MRRDLRARIRPKTTTNNPTEIAPEPLCARVDFHHWEPTTKRDLLGLAPPGAKLFASQRALERIRDLVLGFEIDIAQLEYTELGPYRHSVPEGVLAVLIKHDIAFRSVGRRREFGFNQMFPGGSDFGHSGAEWRRLFRQEILWCRTVDQVHVMSESDGRFLAQYFPDRTDRIPQLDRFCGDHVNIHRRSVTTAAWIDTPQQGPGPIYWTRRSHGWRELGSRIEVSK